MQEFFTGALGLPGNLFAFVILPLIIFIARIAEVSVNTIRIIYMLGGRRYTATILGFFEAFIWLIAMRQIFQHLDNWVCYVAYPGGFAAGIYVGMIIEEKIAYGKVIMRIITRKDVTDLLNYLVDQDLRYTRVNADGPGGVENLVFTVLKRERLDELLAKLREIIPSAFYTIENVKAAGENGALPVGHSGAKIFTWLRGVIRS
jgi:uncharacterized protein YebE (UPF0316 family)